MTIREWPWVLHGLGVLVAVVALVQATRTLPWFKLRRDFDAQRALVTTSLILIGARFGVFDKIPGLRLHFLGAAIATLMFGRSFAVWVMAAVSLVAWLSGAGVWGDPALDFVVCGVLPVFAMQAHHEWVQRRLPNQVFVYVFVTGFFGGAMTAFVSQVSRVLLLVLADAAPTGVADRLVAVPLMMFGEAFFTGGAIAILIVYRPEWVASFDDRRYLRNE